MRRFQPALWAATLLVSLAANAANIYTITNLGYLPNSGNNSSGWAINATGQVAGVSGNMASFWNGSTMIDIGSLGGGLSWTNGINSAGQITGTAYTTGQAQQRAYFWDGTTTTNLGTLGGTRSSASGVNTAGDVVGTSLTAGNAANRAIAWTNGVMSDLNTLLVNGANWLLEGATAINNVGQITGYGTVNQETHAFLLTPSSPAETPEPATALLIGASLLALYTTKKKAAIL